MNDKVDRIPAAFQRIKRRIQRRHIGHIAIDQKIAAKLISQWRHALLQRVALVGERQFRAMFVQLLGDAPCKRFIVRKPHDETAFTLHQSVHDWSLLSVFLRFVCRLFLFGRRDKRSIELCADNHSQPDEPEKEQGNHNPGKTAISQVISENAAQDVQQNSRYN